MSDINDPRVFFAAERTLLAWNRTSLTLMGFGFVVERFALFMRMLMQQDPQHAGLHHGSSFWIGISFILLGVVTAILAILQYRRMLLTFKSVEIPQGYWVNLAVFATFILAALGVLLATYLITDL